jgi:hypothetical protein
MEQGRFGGRYETGMSSRGSCRTTGFRPAHVRSGSWPCKKKRSAEQIAEKSISLEVCFGSGAEY